MLLPLRLSGHLMLCCARPRARPVACLRPLAAACPPLLPAASMQPHAQAWWTRGRRRTCWRRWTSGCATWRSRVGGEGRRWVGCLPDVDARRGLGRCLSAGVCAAGGQAGCCSQHVRAFKQRSCRIRRWLHPAPPLARRPGVEAAAAAHRAPRPALHAGWSWLGGEPLLAGWLAGGIARTSCAVAGGHAVSKTQRRSFLPTSALSGSPCAATPPTLPTQVLPDELFSAIRQAGTIKGG